MIACIVIAGSLMCGDPCAEARLEYRQAEWSLERVWAGRPRYGLSDLHLDDPPKPITLPKPVPEVDAFNDPGGRLWLRAHEESQRRFKAYQDAQSKQLHERMRAAKKIEDQRIQGWEERSLKPAQARSSAAFSRLLACGKDKGACETAKKQEKYSEAAHKTIDSRETRAQWLAAINSREAACQEVGATNLKKE
jgi:hypothetical protein